MESFSKYILDKNMFPFSFKKSPMILTPFICQSLINKYLHAIFILELYHTGISKTLLVFNELWIIFLVKQSQELKTSCQQILFL